MRPVVGLEVQPGAGCPPRVGGGAGAGGAALGPGLPLLQPQERVIPSMLSVQGSALSPGPGLHSSRRRDRLGRALDTEASSQPGGCGAPGALALPTLQAAPPQWVNPTDQPSSSGPQPGPAALTTRPCTGATGQEQLRLCVFRRGCGGLSHPEPGAAGLQLHALHVGLFWRPQAASVAWEGGCGPAGAAESSSRTFTCCDGGGAGGAGGLRVPVACSFIPGPADPWGALGLGTAEDWQGGQVDRWEGTPGTQAPYLLFSFYSASRPWPR